MQTFIITFYFLHELYIIQILENLEEIPITPVFTLA